MAQTYRFGPVEVRPAERQLLVEGRPAPVGARAFDVLMALIDRRDRVVTKDELFDLVWPGLVVEENNLHVQVSTLRKFLGPASVATIPGRGFRFTLPLEQADAPSSTLPARNHNLPAQLNSFIGREREIAEVRELFGTARLVTLTSVGGTGKTRLSLKVAEQSLDSHPDGVWFVELAPLADQQRVPQAVASVLGVKEEAGRPIVEALAKYVKDRRLLIILDNCEHMVQACAELARRLLEAGAHVKILASSRENLHIGGEATYQVPPLAAADAHRLFVERTASVQPDFRITPLNAAVVANICRRLDGIPLAIELAAARAHALPIENIAERLDDCFRLLTRGDQASLPRQQTLRASIDWSYDLLTLPERTLLRRLAVFAGGWTLEAAEAVGAAGDVDGVDILDLLTRLVEKSLVELDTRRGRFRLLETMRQYAQERLNEVGESGATFTRHLHYYLSLAEKARPELTGPNQGAWLDRLDLERENVFSALAWSDHAPDGAELGLRLVRALKHYFVVHGLVSLGYRITIEALARARVEPRNPMRRGALFDAGQLAYFTGRYADAQAYLDESIALARELEDKRAIANALQPLGMACLGLGELAAARRHLDEALQLAQEIDQKRSVAAAKNALAQLHRVAGDLDKAEPLYESVLEMARELDDPESIAIGLLNLAMTSIGRGLGDRARLMLVEALAIAEEIGSKAAGQSVLEVCAGLAAQRGSFEHAARCYGAAEEQAAQTGLHRDPADEAFLAPLVDKARAALGVEAFDRAEAAGRALAYDTAIAEARAWLDKA